eukprot:3237773-Pyramimonas_sp.AAC.1
MPVARRGRGGPAEVAGRAGAQQRGRVHRRRGRARSQGTQTPSRRATKITTGRFFATFGLQGPLPGLGAVKKALRRRTRSQGGGPDLWGVYVVKKSRRRRSEDPDPRRHDSLVVSTPRGPDPFPGSGFSSRVVF